MKRIIAAIDRLEEDLERMTNIRNAVRRMKERVEAVSEKLDRSQSRSQGHSRDHGSSTRHDPRRR